MTPARDSEGRERFVLIEGLRALAAFSVLWGHAAYAWFPTGEDSMRLHVARRVAPLGVAIFFAISGFVLYRPFVVRRSRGITKMWTGRYLVRRVVRIVPAYWLALTCLAIF